MGMHCCHGLCTGPAGRIKIYVSCKLSDPLTVGPQKQIGSGIFSNKREASDRANKRETITKYFQKSKISSIMQ